MAIYIKVNNIEYPTNISGTNKDRSWGERDTKIITLTMTTTDVATLLPDNTPWSIVRRETVDKLDNDGNPTGETEEVVNEWDNSEYSLAGDITDHRDGTVSIKMGKPTEAELSDATVTALVGPEHHAAARGKAATDDRGGGNEPDGRRRSKAVELFPNWSEHIGEAVIPGQRMGDTDDNGVLRLYKVREGKGHTTQADWAPHLTPDLWVVIDVAHAGTIEDPIPAARGMEYEYGKYYLDGEDSKTYLCNRTGEAAGGTIVLQYMPHELVGNYFELAN